MEVILRLQEQTIDHDLGAGFQVMVLANLLTFLFLLFIGAGMSRSFTRSILKLSDAAQAVAKGDLDQRVPVTTKDEIGTLSESFNMMIEGLQQREAAERERQAAEAANHAKSAFLANMSHELRTPLNAILGFTQLMSRDQRLMPDQHENLSVINRSGEHLLALINDVLEMSKIEAGRTTLVEHTFDLHYMLDGLEDMFHLKAANKGLHLIVERTPDVPRSVCTDEGKLRQVLMNLLSNAIKFTEDGGVIVRVTSEEKADQEPNDGRATASAQQLLFEIEDTGVGIAQDEIDQLFDAFVQTSSGRQSQEGTGLGLPISRQFVRLMGGDIYVRSQPGEGSTFAFHIQVYLADSAATQTALPARTVVSLASDQPGYRILIVDDRWPSRQLLSKLLHLLGFDIREASNGQEGLDIWETWEPHLIFMDMRMPVMDGYEATRRIKRTPRGQSTVIIALTASAFEEDRAIVLSAGCDDFIRKPFREAVIFEVLTCHLGVQFVYADEAAREHASNCAAEAALSPGDLRGLPDGWVRDLQQAAVQGDTDLLFRLIEHIREQHPALAERLTTLAHNYQFEPIIDAATDVSPHEHTEEDAL
jgi:signal transduction histidine kinase/CheY-like chemotaxis protein